ncbi:MAG: cytochrome c oxidase assembly protein [Xanthomonadaceae bacterium]|nr:cytochrome c oxidase assembly protein [Xanthomonadaceae bacterium]
MLSSFVTWAHPWEPIFPLYLCLACVAVLYSRGVGRARVRWPRRSAFWSGLALIYLFQLTHYDFYAEHEFFLHRLQQLVLHHLAPLLIVISYPGAALRAGMPLRWRIYWLQPFARSHVVRFFTRIALNPMLVSTVFVASVLVWLIPSVQTVAMLDWRIYRFMNVSMLVSGLTYWWLVLDHRPCPPGRMPVALRVLSPAVTMTPQILAGAFIALSRNDLYPIFTICGRALSMSASVDQQLGGLIIWIPASMIEVVGAMCAMKRWMTLSGNPRISSRTAAIRI